MNTSTSKHLFERACQLIPGGVNSPVRAFKGVGGTPLFIERGEGAYLFDVDGNQYIDYVGSWGPLILGHAHQQVTEAISAAAKRGTSFGAPTKQENDLAELIIALFPSIDMVRFVNSGTEATMSAIRLARAVTGRSKFIKFDGGYHGHADMLLAQAGSGIATLGLPECPGVVRETTLNTIVLPYNDIAALEATFASHADEVAGVIVEPIAGNMGFVMPFPEFLPSIQRLCQTHGALFILDEVMTGFRAGWPGAQTIWGLNPDITCLGKVVGGGLPLAIYAGKRDIMQHVAPAGTMYQAGTLSGNPLATTAGIATLQVLLKDDGIFSAIARRTDNLTEGLRQISWRHGIPMQIGSMGTFFGFYFLTEEMPVTNFDAAKKYVDKQRYSKFFHAMLNRGCYFAPSAFEAGFMSAAHSDANIEYTLDMFEKIVLENLLSS